MAATLKDLTNFLTGHPNLTASLDTAGLVVVFHNQSKISVYTNKAGVTEFSGWVRNANQSTTIKIDLGLINAVVTRPKDPTKRELSFQDVLTPALDVVALLRAWDSDHECRGLLRSRIDVPIAIPKGNNLASRELRGILDNAGSSGLKLKIASNYHTIYTYKIPRFLR